MRKVALLLLLTLTGCAGYQVGTGGSLEEYCTICVPYIEGDHNGTLTSQVVREISTSSPLRYTRTGGQLVLNVCFLDLREENIGFRYDRDKGTNTTDNVIPAETRYTAMVEVTVSDQRTGCDIVGPDKMSVSVDFDHDYYSNHGGVNVSSLGQLNDLDLAHEVARRPLYRVLARRIVEHISNAW